MNSRCALTDEDFRRWNVALRQLLEDDPDLESWVRGSLRGFFHFTRLLLVHAELLAGEVRLTHWLAIDHSREYVDQLSSRFNLQDRGSIIWWLSNRAPFIIEPQSPPPYATDFEIDEIIHFNLDNVAAHGVVDPGGGAGTYFSFCGVSSPSAWHVEALKIIAPVLNDVFIKHLAGNQSRPSIDALTPRQLELVRLVAGGSNDKQIAARLGISVRTVRNLLSDAYGRLGVKSRSHLMLLLRGWAVE